MNLYPLVALAALAASLGVSSPSTVGAASAMQPAAASEQGALDTVAFPTERAGWLGGTHTILATTDGGKTWTRQYTGTTTIVQFSFISNTTGWAMGRGSLLNTTDGGRSWAATHKPPHALRQIAFVSPARGWAIAGTNPTHTLLYRTTDGGTTWTRQSLSMPVGAVCFSDPAHGWAAKAFSAQKTSVTLVTTTDGGTSWRPVASPPGVGGIDGFEGQSLGCPVQGTVWDLVTFGGYAGGAAYALYRSADSGAHWQVVAQVMAPGNPAAARGPGSAPGALAAPSARVAYLTGTCFACGGQGTTSVGETLDGGKSWRNLGVPGLPTSTTTLSFPTAQNGWLVAEWQTGSSQAQSAVFQTTDGGLIWQRREPAPQGMVQVTFTLSLYGAVPVGQEFAIAGPRALGDGSGAIPICTTIASHAKLGLVRCVGNHTVYTRHILMPRGATFHFYFERFTPKQPVTPDIIYSGTSAPNMNVTISAYFRFGS